jgi:5,10-methylene-tetrahydrofolate dehydrogenase/methenyl tetrahydrofolate cyclohydrolase
MRPQGCIELLERSGVKISGARAVVVGRSNIVGLPAALLLQNRDATVTMVHSRTPNAQKTAAGADVTMDGPCDCHLPSNMNECTAEASHL